MRDEEEEKRKRCAVLTLPSRGLRAGEGRTRREKGVVVVPRKHEGKEKGLSFTKDEGTITKKEELLLALLPFYFGWM